MNPDAIITVELRDPKTGKTVRQSMKVDEHIFEESLAPLSRYHDAPFDYRAQAQAHHQWEMRQVIAKQLSNQLATAILKAAESQDPHMGYSPQEWAAIQGANA